MATFSQTNVNHTMWPFPFAEQDWQQTPPSVQQHVVTLQNQLNELNQPYEQLQPQVDMLQGRIDKPSQTSSKPPSSDSPFQKLKRRQAAGNRGAKRGPPGSGPTLLAPPEGHHVYPAPCSCGHGDLAAPRLYHIQQMMERPPIDMQITQFLLHQARCGGCGRMIKAEVPAEYTTGYGPRLRGCIGDLSGMHDTSRRLMQHFCHSVLHIPISLGAIQKVIARVAWAIVPPYGAIAEGARNATVGSMDEPPWFCHNALQGLWTMNTETASLFRIHANRSKEALCDLIQEWKGILVSGGYGVYQTWGNRRQTCVAHWMRTARGWAETSTPELAAWGRWALKELQRLGHMAKAPPSGGEWSAWYARFGTVIGRDRERPDGAGRLARRWQREMASLWGFLCEHGVEATNNRAARALRFGVRWRKRSGGTDRVKGNHWVERSVSLRQPCHQLGQSPLSVLVDAVRSLFSGRQPDLTWLY